MGKRKSKSNSKVQRVRMSVERVLVQFFPPDPRMNMSALKLFDIMEFSTAMEERFVHLLAMMLVMVKEYAGEEGMSVQQAVAEVAYRLGVSVATVKRYLQKHAVSIGPFKVQGRRVFLREWVWENIQDALAVLRQVPVDGAENTEKVVKLVWSALEVAFGQNGRGGGPEAEDLNAFI